jgi:hypothetical protein
VHASKLEACLSGKIERTGEVGGLFSDQRGSLKNISEQRGAVGGSIACLPKTAHQSQATIAGNAWIAAITQSWDYATEMDYSGILDTVKALGVVGGVCFSVWSFNSTRVREVQKPFLELRQKLYMEAIRQAGILTNPDDHTEDEIRAARRRFRELYVAELSMVEPPEVEAYMVKLAKQIDPELIASFSPARKAAYDLSHALRDSFVASWRVKK